MIEGGSVNRAPEIGFKISQESELLPVTLVSLKHTYGVNEFPVSILCHRYDNIYAQTF